MKKEMFEELLSSVREAGVVLRGREKPDQARFLAAVEKGIAAAERSEFIEEEEMDARLRAMFKA